MAREQWTYTADGVIWKLLYAPSEKIIGEVRNITEKKATFFCLDAKTGVPLWKNVQKDDPWWIEIECADRNAVYFSRFVQPDIPQHRGIECCSISDCTTLWRNDEVTFWFEQDDKLCVYKDQYEQRHTYWISKKTGEVLEEVRNAQEIAHSVEIENRVTVPIPLDMTQEWQSVVEYVRNHRSGDVLESSIEVIPLENVVVVGYYTRNGNGLVLHLDVYARATQQLVYSVIQETGCHYPVGENFFVVDSMLYYVKDQRTLVGVNVWK